ncbi:MAG: sortase [Eggerthellaceae bacterium]|jgi:LPXTG-site transpeptidase (sortase) family protein|nr:sortase [Eggerthellaceae bacterium]MDR2715514.1 sortase [Coriobacteriaceae bacterium]
MDRSTRRRKIASVFLFIIGLSILMYPHVAQYINNLHATQLVTAYFAEGPETGGDGTGGGAGGSGGPGGDIDFSDSDIFGSIVIPKLALELPIFTGPTAENLERGIAHVEGTSLPVGGASTHSVLAGHHGRVTNEWFTNIDQLTEGDLFYIRTKEQFLTYKVISLKVIDPEDNSDLLIVPDRDLVTLYTCTPSRLQRVIVTGERLLNDSWT